MTASSPPTSPPAPQPPADHDSHHEILHAEVRFGDTLKRDYPLIWWATLIGPFVLTAATLGYLWFDRGWEFMVKLCGTALVTFFGLGRFVILLGSDQTAATASAIEGADRARFSFLTSTELLVMVTWMDLFVACLLIFHAGFLFRIPKLGPALLKLREEGEFFMSYQPWMRRFTFVGLVLFVAFPLAATGSVAGSIFGRLLGMSKLATCLALVAGTALGNGGMYLVGQAILAWVPFFNPNNPWNLLLGAALIFGIIFLLGWRYTHLKRAHLEDKAKHAAKR